MGLKDCGDECSESFHTHSGPAGQAINPLDQLQACAQVGSRDRNRFHVAKRERDLVDRGRYFVALSFGRYHGANLPGGSSSDQDSVLNGTIAFPYERSTPVTRNLERAPTSDMLPGASQVVAD